MKRTIVNRGGRKLQNNNIRSYPVVKACASDDGLPKALRIAVDGKLLLKQSWPVVPHPN